MIRRQIIFTCWAADFASPARGEPGTGHRVSRARGRPRSRLRIAARGARGLLHDQGRVRRRAAFAALCPGDERRPRGRSRSTPIWGTRMPRLDTSSGDYELDWAGAEEGYLRAIALDARECNGSLSARATAWLRGRFDEGLAEMEIARQLEPLWAPAAANHACWSCWQAATRKARPRRGARSRSTRTSRIHAACSGAHCWARQRYDEALEAFRSRRAPGPGSYADVAVTLAAAGRSGRGAAGPRRIARAFAAALCARLRHRNWIRGLGEQEAALDWLDKAVEERANMQVIRVDPALASLHANPRFKTIVKRVGVPDSA